MGWIESQLRTLALRVEYLYRLITALQAQLTNARQQLTAVWQTTSGGGSSSTGPRYYCVAPSSGSWGATWTSGAPVTPGSFTATVYQIAGSTITSMGSQTVNNWYPASPVVSLVIQVMPDGSGDYQVLAQSCS